MTQTKAALHEIVEQLPEPEAVEMLGQLRMRRLDAQLARADEIEPDETDREMLAELTAEDYDPSMWRSSDDVHRKVGITDSVRA